MPITGINRSPYLALEFGKSVYLINSLERRMLKSLPLSRMNTIQNDETIPYEVKAVGPLLMGGLKQNDVLAMGLHVLEQSDSFYNPRSINSPFLHFHIGVQEDWKETDPIYLEIKFNLRHAPFTTAQNPYLKILRTEEEMKMLSEIPQVSRTAKFYDFRINLFGYFYFITSFDLWLKKSKYGFDAKVKMDQMGLISTETMDYAHADRSLVISGIDRENFSFDIYDSSEDVNEWRSPLRTINITNKLKARDVSMRCEFKEVADTLTTTTWADFELVNDHAV